MDGSFPLSERVAEHLGTTPDVRPEISGGLLGDLWLMKDLKIKLIERVYCHF
ncbi:hypothetical protein ACSSV8_003180 [Roseovarius sp. MBR-79]|jgi:hypothetical protein